MVRGELVRCRGKALQGDPAPELPGGAERHQRGLAALHVGNEPLTIGPLDLRGATNRAGRQLRGLSVFAIAQKNAGAPAPGHGEEAVTCGHDRAAFERGYEQGYREIRRR